MLFNTFALGISIEMQMDVPPAGVAITTLLATTMESTWAGGVRTEMPVKISPEPPTGTRFMMRLRSMTADVGKINSMPPRAPSPPARSITLRAINACAHASSMASPRPPPAM